MYICSTTTGKLKKGFHTPDLTTNNLLPLDKTPNVTSSPAIVYFDSKVFASFRVRDFVNQNLSPSSNSKSANLGKNVWRQNEEAYPGHEAEFLPAELMYQFEHPAENTDPVSWFCMSLAK